LRHLYGGDHVTYVRNITDVDDKINDRAARDFPGLARNEAIRRVTEQTEKQFHADVDALGCLRPTVEPRATEHIAEMRAIIEKLVQGGFAYVAEDHVLFSPQAMNAANSVLPRYGALAKRSLDEMIAGARGELGVAVRHQGGGAAGLAHRMLGDGVEASRSAVRYPRRRHRSGVSASRERTRAKLLRFSC